MNAELRDDELIRRARQGDRAAFDRLAVDNEGALRVLIALELGREVQGRVEVDDLLQETLLRAFRSLPQFRGQTAAEFRGWLARIAHHAVIDGARRLTAQKADCRREVPLLEDRSGGGEQPPLLREPISPVTPPSGNLRRLERLERLHEAIDTLSPDHREVVRLTFIDRLPAREVARRLGRSDKALSMLLLRALRSLREVFGGTSSLTLPRGPRSGTSADAGGLSSSPPAIRSIPSLLLGPTSGAEALDGRGPGERR